jgi:hypothetical protein
MVDNFVFIVGVFELRKSRKIQLVLGIHKHMKTLQWFTRNSALSHLRIATAVMLTSAAVAMALVAVTVPATYVSASNINGTLNGAISFSNTPLLRDAGDSEPAISIHPNGTMAMTALSWLTFGTPLWSGPFGSTPTFRGIVDSDLQVPGPRLVFGGGDADVDLGSTGTLHASTLIFITPPTIASAVLGVSAITCPNGTSGTLAVPGDCTSQVIDTAGADRQWITSDGRTVYISYHDSGNSTLIHVQRSDDDGYSWTRVHSPIPGQGRDTANATFNNDQGPIVADPVTHNVYDIYAAGEPSVQKGSSADFNNIYVSRSTDRGRTWTATLVYHAPLFTALNNVFPALAVDPTNGKLYASWSDAHRVFFSTSSDQGLHWTAAVAVNIPPANTAVFPWVAAYNGTVDVVYYGTPAASKDDPTAVWDTFMAQTTDDGASFVQSKVSNTSNHVGVICTAGTGCPAGTRNLLDLFEVAINPSNGKAAVIYTDDRLTTSTDPNNFACFANQLPPCPLPQVVLAQQN